MNEPTTPGDLNPPEVIVTPDFRAFAMKEGYREDTIDPANNFAIRESSEEEHASRDYFAINPSGGFSVIPIAEIYLSDIDIDIRKRGRPIVRDNNAYHEEEAIRFLVETFYSLDHLKGQLDYDGKINSLGIRFSDEGKFDEIYFTSQKEEGPFNKKTSGTYNYELKSHFEKSNKPFILQCEGGSVILVEDNESAYSFYLISPDGNPDKKIVVNKKVASREELLEGLGINDIIANKLQPAHGIKGKSHGDDLWRYANFSDIMGVHVTPIDTPEDLSEFEEKGFGKLVADIAKQV